MAGRVSVLLVDDEPTIARLYAAAIQRYGFDLMVCDNPRDALSLVGRHRPGLIVSDVQMPGMDGYDFCTQLIDRGLKHCPLIFLTGNDDIRMVRAGLKAGGDDFVIKGKGLDWMMQRVGFWFTSGFKGLPADARRRAIAVADQRDETEVAPIGDTFHLDTEVFRTIAAQLHKEVQHAGHDFGDRLVQRILILGRLSRLILDASTDLGSLMRFPDYVVGVLEHLRFPWAHDLDVLLSRFDELTDDARFCAAGQDGLRALEMC